MSFGLYRPGLWQRLVLSLASSRPASWVLARILPQMDRFVLRLTRGEQSLTTLLTGLPVVRLTTRGARSGLPRVSPLVPLRDGDKLVLFATNFGSTQHPAWYYNLTVNPEVIVSRNGVGTVYRARQADEAERERYWQEALTMYHGYGEYERRARGRRIPIFILSPVEPVRLDSG